MTRARDRRGASARHTFAGAGGGRAAHDRTRIAQATARLIAEHGMTDWSAAKRKAARQLGVPEGLSLPSNDDVQQALAEYHALFAAAEHTASLHAQRVCALKWMRRLERWSPLLVGGVAAGWASAHSDIRIELVADDPKTVEMMLAGHGVRYAALPNRGDEAAEVSAELLVHGEESDVRLSVLTSNQRRNRPRREDDPRLTPEELAALIAQE